MPHSSITYLLSPTGQYATHYPDILSATEIARRLRSILPARMGAETIRNGEAERDDI